MSEDRAARLRQARIKAGYESAKAAVDAFGWEVSAYRHHENGTRNFDADTAKRYARAFKVDAGWLLALSAAPVKSEVQPTRSASADDDTVELVALDLSLSMGPGTLIEHFVEAEPVKFDIGMLRSITRSPYHRLRIVRGIGDSMEPTLRSGDRIMIDTTERAMVRLDGIYWVHIFGAHGIKRLKKVSETRVLVVSDNPGIPNDEFDLADVRIEGRAIWFSREL